MKQLEILTSQSYDFMLSVDNIVIFSKPIDCVDVLEVTALLCKKYNIPSGEVTLSIYYFIEDKFNEIKAEKEEDIMNKRFFSGVA
jgi:hypothetical protein